MAWRRGQAYAQDLRDRVLAADDLSAREAAERFGVSPSYVVKVRQRRDHAGDVTPGPQRSWTPRKLAAQHAAIAAQVRERPDVTLAELCAWLLGQFGISASLSTMWNTVRRLGLTRKKSASKPPSRRAPILPKRAACGASGRAN
jgi:transposase